MKIEQLFQKYQKELLSFVNTQFGRSYIGHSGQEAYQKYPIVWIGRSGFTQFLGFNKNKPILRYTTYPGTKKYGEIHDKLFGTILSKLEIADKYRINNPKDLPFVIPHFMGETQKLSNQLPQIFLATLTANPQAGGGGGNVTVDGPVLQTYAIGSGTSWATIRGAAGSNAYPSESGVPASNGLVYMQCDNVSDQFFYITRSILTFNTAPLAGATGVTATLSLYGQDKVDASGQTPDTQLYGATPANNNNLVAGDYAQCGGTAYSSAITYANFTAAAYNDWILNATALTALNLTGVSPYSMRNANHDVANSAPTWGNQQFSYTNIQFADYSTNLPKLVVTYTPSLGVQNKGYSYFM